MIETKPDQSLHEDAVATVEPFQAGKTSAPIEGDLCSEPMASFQHEIFRTLIFDLEKEGAVGSR